ncbi:hypothetical protein EJ04DRAFT_136926 [Polyplosphaeria fusca]|uniref:Uncharacterized protein n=1 Tax=Polyplosphaeria fusca TaxID=682080 RepID=A0A9P4UW30_9PLEO|nr:hypothetical protein EJ04DRAFT_136926 [Polyplosphaeria fusca]
MAACIPSLLSRCAPVVMTQLIDCMRQTCRKEQDALRRATREQTRQVFFRSSLPGGSRTRVATEKGKEPDRPAAHGTETQNECQGHGKPRGRLRDSCVMYRSPVSGPPSTPLPLGVFLAIILLCHLPLPFHKKAGARL